ncbi:uncharacterized protein M6B38_201890 [Iris pallida]|uniref:PX domain-containing protein n=1 Tax=Iris pallida TaxID=29817 RepID=A0AAX6E9F5_IRIPA|nr:uncharacterized protein M6B38_201890 [Iris pallida]
MDPLESSRNFDGEDASLANSDYSSCDGSDLDRYCSANSALGSASVCSSIGNSSELLDSLKKSGRWNGDFANLNGFDGVSDGGNETPRGNHGTRTRSRLFATSAEEPRERFDVQRNLGQKSRESFDLDGNLGRREYGSSSNYNIGGSIEQEADGEALSDVEDSMLDSGSDDEGRAGFSKGYGLQREKETEDASGKNPLFMSSSVAFGADDWDEFVQETEGNGFDSMWLHRDQQVLHAKEAPLEDIVRDDSANLDCNVEKTTAPDADEINEINVNWVPGESQLSVSPLCESTAEQAYTTISSVFHGNEMQGQENDGSSSLQPKDGDDATLERVVEGNSYSMAWVEKDLLPDEGNKLKKLERDDSYDDMVLEMEDILLDSGDSLGPRSQTNRGYIMQHSHQSIDASSTASTSGTEDAYPLTQYPVKIDWVEVVGAKQKTGDVSFGERLVGVKEYTIYKLRVWSDKDQWEIERRYRDFFALYCQLSTLFSNHGLSLPSPWSSVEQQSRKIFGNASPNVISERSVLIQNCLRSLLNSKYSFGTPSPLVSFLSPSKAMPNSSLLKSLVPQSLQKLGQDINSSFSKGLDSSPDVSTLGKTISLVVELKPRKSMRQLLEAQHYTCAGCHRHLDARKTLLRELVQTLGWNKPRFCVYSGQLFCVSCHSNDTSVLPAKVLHHWDFSLYPVSQFAKAYLESIYDQPMLCVSAVNPFLFSKVPALLHVMGIRKKIGAMLPYVRCPFRTSVQRSLGIRRYLLESNDFFALRDLVDLSKGAFAGLPVMVETVSTKILEHVTEQCLVCYDSGISCAARQACDDPSSLIFPFQEAEAERCGSCGSLFHKPCFVKLMGRCPCGKLPGGRTATGSTESSRVSDRSLRPSNSNLPSGFLSGVLSKARPGNVWKPKSPSPVILMGSLPSTSL